MLSLPDSQRIPRRKRALAVTGLLLLLTTQSLAQSGRRTPKTQGTNNPTVNTDDATPKPADRQLTRKVAIIVAKQPTSKRLLSEDSIFASFINRLNEITNLTTTSAGDLKKENAVARAKRESESFVVLLQFDIDSFQNGTIILNSPDLDVRVLVFEPHTGQEKFKGKIYYKAAGGGIMRRDNWPNGTPIKITPEAVGIEAAEQILDWLVLRSQH